MYERLLADASIQRAEGGANDEEAAGPGKPALTAAQKRLKYLKIGAAAVGGGALLAVTGMCPRQNLPGDRAGMVWYAAQHCLSAGSMHADTLGEPMR